jgi:hypothetical protein
VSTPAIDSVWTTILRVCVVVALLAGSLALVFPPIADSAGDFLNGGSTGETTPQRKETQAPLDKEANAESKSPTRTAPLFRPEWGDPAEAPQLAPSFAEYRPVSESTDDDATTGINSSVKPASATVDAPTGRPTAQAYQAELKRLGATYVVVEQMDDSDLFECRCLANLNAKFSRAFAAEAATPAEAAAMVVEQIKQWRRTNAKVASSESKTGSKVTPGDTSSKSPAKSKERRMPKQVER